MVYLVSIVDEYPNPDVSCNIRYDSVIYDLVPEPAGKRERPAKKGKRLSPEVDSTLSNEKIGSYYLGRAELFQMLQNGLISNSPIINESRKVVLF